MSNKMIEDIEKLDEVIDNIDNKELDSAKDKLVVWRDNLKKELEAMELYFTKHEQFEPNTGHATESVQVMGVTGYDDN
jgi:predicted transcriptional regulator